MTRPIMQHGGAGLSRALFVTRFATAALAVVVASAAPAAAQVSFPQTPAELVAMLEDDALETDEAHRAFVLEAVRYVAAREAGEATRPYTDAVQAWFSAELASDGRASHMFATSLMAALTIDEPIDLYLLMGQSNMVGLTESGGYNGPDPEIRAALQAATPDRTVVTLNCALSASFLANWEPQTVSFNDLGGKLRHNLTKTCIESARGIANTAGERAKIRGLFFYQGESDVSLAYMFETPDPIDTWPARYAAVIDFLRIEFGEVPAVHARIAVNGNPDPQLQAYWSLMQQRQAEAVALVPNSASIATADLAVHDGIHLDDASQAIAGQRFADAMLSLTSP